MRRRAFNILARLSLLLCVATCIMWVRSYWCVDTFWRQGWRLESEGDDGQLPRWLQSSDGSLSWRYYPRWWGVPVDHAFLGFRYYYGRDSQPPGTGTYYHWLVAAVPYWFFFVLTSMPVAGVLVSRHKMARLKRHGLCLTCGHDLRASPERCPECGAAVAAR